MHTLYLCMLYYELGTGLPTKDEITEGNSLDIFPYMYIWRVMRQTYIEKNLHADRKIYMHSEKRHRQTRIQKETYIIQKDRHVQSDMKNIIVL